MFYLFGLHKRLCVRACVLACVRAFLFFLGKSFSQTGNCCFNKETYIESKI